MAMADSQTHALAALDVEASAGANGDAPNVRSRLDALWHAGAHHVTRLKAANLLFSHQVTAREPVFGQPRALIRASTGGLDRHRRPSPVPDRRDRCDARRIARMRFVHAKTRAMVFGAAA